ncbi:phosphatases II [Gautieria morchelliformis]|nr:phosphatases II [Gautieria morchelliformis]
MSAIPPHAPHAHPLDSCQTDSLIPAPIENSYWATPLLCASEYPFSPGQPQPQLDKLLKAGIRTFIDLTEPHELLPYEYHLRARARAVGIPDMEQLWYYRFPIRDRSTPPNDGQTMLGIMAVLQECERLGRKAVVHCRGGIGRTGTVVGCWFIQSGRVTDGEGALQTVKILWKKVEKCKRYPNSPETGQQCEFVKGFARVVLDDALDAKS